MLKNYLTSIPYTKFVLIQDSVHDRGKPIFDFLLKTHLEKPENKIHYLVFQERYGKSKSTLNYRNLVLYDFVSNVLGWNEEPKTVSLEDVIKSVGVRDIIFIDSLAHTIYEYGLAETYRVLNTLKNQTGIQQIVALLHKDLLEDTFKVQQLLQHLSTFSISLLPENEKDNRRIQYTYKKLGGKIVKEVEEYLLEGDSFLTQKIEKLTPEQLLKNSIPAEINPETLSTFKIGLNDLEKKSRDELVLPYLPKEETRKNQESGKIFYQFDEVDDWDEEDPDDDLDI